ncbi:heme ABC exporter ATP-binding protein CcmA, partial [Bartonella taylorii]|uniref:heme ABC exporter ATP-binding protein CcmA n=1 Tax=Bartonella taylorii TaxID=33046 RepID=UPI001ABACF9A
KERTQTYPLASVCHYLSIQNAMKSSLSVIDNLQFWAAFYSQYLRTPHEALADVGLSDLGHLPFRVLSTGQNRRVAIARLLLSYRPVWILDEPTSGVDSHTQSIFANLFQNHLIQGGMIIAATHTPLVLPEIYTIALEHFLP